MEISFFGAAGEVGRSCILIESKNTKVLLDAGIKLGNPIEFPELKHGLINKIDAILLSHAHLDHCGYLPHIYSQGFSQSTYATKPTIELMQVLLSDYIKISQPKDLEKNIVTKVIKNTKIVEYKREIKIKDLTVSFTSAGHIVGSAMIRISDGKDTLLYTGDMNLSETKLLNSADLHNLKANILVMEGTRSGEFDISKPQKENIQEFIKIVKDTILAGGKVLIPSFAVGRGQEVLLILDDYINSGMIPKVPLFIDGMINKVMRIHRHNVIYCKKELQMRILMSDSDPFKSENFVPVESKSQRQKIVHSNESSIVVTTSGMITGGPIMFYLPRMAKDKMNTLIIVGYQAVNTLGRVIQDGEKDVEIDGKKVHISMNVKYIRLSAHLDRKQLKSLPNKIPGVKKIFLIHGEATKTETLKEELSKKYDVILPKMGSSYHI